MVAQQVSYLLVVYLAYVNVNAGLTLSLSLFDWELPARAWTFGKAESPQVLQTFQSGLHVYENLDVVELVNLMKVLSSCLNA